MPKKTSSTTKRLYTPEDMGRSMHVMDGVLAADGTFAIYQLAEIVSGGDPDTNRQVNSLWRIDLNGGTPKRLTPEGRDASSPQLTPDGTAVLFLSPAQSGAIQVHRLPVDGGEAEPVTSLAQGITSFELSPDGTWIAFAAFAKPPQPPTAGGHARINRFVYRFDPIPGLLQDFEQAVYLMPVAGGEHRALTPPDGIVGTLAWSPDSREIAVVTFGKVSQRRSAAFAELSVVDREGRLQILVDEAIVLNPFWTADGQQIGFIGRADGDYSRQSQLFLVDSKGGTPISRTSTLNFAVGCPIQVSNPSITVKDRLQLLNDDVVVPISRGGEVALCRVALSGPESCTPLVEGPRLCRVLGVAGTTLLFLAQDFHTPNELWTVDIDTAREQTLTHHNAAWLAQIDLPHVETVRVKSATNVEVEGWVMLPPKGHAPFKTLLFIHGGPHSGYGCSFNEDFLELAGAGYAIAFANPRGSTGYGDDFSTSIVGCWGEPERVDLNGFLDELIRRGIADADCLGVGGISGGGHLTAWLITHSNRFKAAVPEQGIYNMISVYGVSDAGVALTEMELGGPPHEQIERYWELSPLAHAHTCKTPTLLIQGENDVRCPMEQAEQLYTVLKQSGCEVELLRLRNCNHAAQLFGPPTLRRTRMVALKDWFDRHISQPQ